MKRFLALWLVCCLFTLSAPCALAEVEDYTVAGKLLKQLWAGSGFTGTLTVEMAAQKEGALATQKPLVFDVDYIYVRPDDLASEEHRADIALVDGGETLSALHMQFKDGEAAFQADAAGDKWYSFAAGGTGETAQAAAAAGSEALSHTGMPALTEMMLAAAAAMSGAEGLGNAMDDYTTRVDVWIEGHRQDAILGKLEDGTTTMEVNYRVSPAALKAQVKQLVFDLLNDEQTLAALQSALGEEMASLYLNPALQSWYFDSIDALALAGDMTISRTVSMKGDTLNLSLNLPLYDREGGNVLLRYDRTQGEGDLPDSNVLHLESALRIIDVIYQEYSSMTGVNVVRGTFESGHTDGSQPFAAAFTLTQETGESKDEEKRDVYSYGLKLSLSPVEEGAFPETEIALTSSFASKELKSAATQVKAVLALGGDGWDSAVTLSFEGASCKKWEPQPIEAERVSLSSLSQAELALLLSGPALQLAELLKPYLTQP